MMGSRGQQLDRSMDDVVTYDGFLGDRLTIAQPRSGHRSGHDAVLLAAAISPAGPQICEFGCGVGVASLCLLSRLPDVHVTGLDIDTHAGQLAVANAEKNGFGGRFEFQPADVRRDIAQINMAVASMDHIFFNPPYYRHGEVQPLANSARQQAHHMAQGELDLWCRRAASFLRAEGHITLIAPARDLAAVLLALSPRFGGLRVKPILPRPDAEASRVIISGQRDQRGPLTLLAPLILQDRSGNPSLEAEQILRGGGALALSAAER